MQADDAFAGESTLCLSLLRPIIIAESRRTEYEPI